MKSFRANRILRSCIVVLAMSKAAVKIAGDLLSNPLCELDQAFLESMMALDTAMKRMEAFNQEKVRAAPSLLFTHLLNSQGST